VRKSADCTGKRQGSAVVLSSARYDYHDNGTVSEAEYYSAGTPSAYKRYKYAFPSYDALNRLKGADFSLWSGGGWTGTPAHSLSGIDYDRSGNLTALQRYQETGALIDNLNYTYSSSSKWLSRVTDAVSGNPESWDAKSGNFSYDANGNLKTAPAPYSIADASYDHRNLPLSLTSKGATTNYRYDHTGQRIAKQTASGNTEIYLLDGPTTLAVYTVNGSGGVVSSHFNVLSGDRVVGRQPNVGARKYYHTDLLGSTRAVVEGAAVVESYDYDPWGLLLPGRTLGSGTKDGFTGKERDAESGLDYFGARHYMAALGRWTTVDPPADSFPSWSPYNYVQNNPPELTDPFGLASCPPFCRSQEHFFISIVEPVWNALMSKVKVEQEVQHGFTTVSHNGSLAGNNDPDANTTVATSAQIPALAIKSAVGIDFTKARTGSKTGGLDAVLGAGPLNVGIRITGAVDEKGLQDTGVRLIGSISTPGPFVSPFIRDTDCSQDNQCSQIPYQ
jgi:RHS repeat-associated protein